METLIKIQNLKCHGCANTIVTQLSKLNGIDKVSVNNETDKVSFNYNSQTQLETVKIKLSDLGYPLENETNLLPKKLNHL